MIHIMIDIETFPCGSRQMASSERPKAITSGPRGAVVSRDLGRRTCLVGADWNRNVFEHHYIIGNITKNITNHMEITELGSFLYKNVWLVVTGT